MSVKLVKRRCRPGRAVTQGCPTCSRARFILTWTGTVPQGVWSGSAVASSDIAYSRTARQPPKAHAQGGAKLGCFVLYEPPPRDEHCDHRHGAGHQSFAQAEVVTVVDSISWAGWEASRLLLFGVFSAPPAVPVMQQLTSRRWSRPTFKLWPQPGPGSLSGQECRF